MDASPALSQFGEQVTFSPEEIERIKADSRRAYKNDKTVGQHSLRKKVDRKGNYL